jgi:hypothetical protein
MRDAIERTEREAAEARKHEEDERRRHEDEAKRKAEWDAKQAEKKAAVAKAIQELLTMTDDDVVNQSVKRTGDDLERLTRRNMKMCVTEHIQMKCYEDPAVFGRLVCHPRQSMINCFKYINRKAEEFIKTEMEMRGEKASGAVGEDVPDDMCYQWAEDYFNDPDAEADKDKDDTFIPKPFYGGSSSSKSKKKEPAEKKEADKPKPLLEKKHDSTSAQMGLFEEVA